MYTYVLSHLTITLVYLVSHLTMVLSTPTLQYQHYRLETICGMYQDKRVLNLKTQPAVLTFNERYSKVLKCHLDLHLPSEKFGFSVFIETLRFNNGTGCENDFLQFGRDYLIFTSHKSKKICGTIEPIKQSSKPDGSIGINYGNSSRKEREYIEAEDDDMDIWLRIEPPGRNEDTKELKLIVTPFKKVCASNDFFYKKCPSNDKCIKRELFCDGLINCGGEEKDEEEKHCGQSSILPGTGVFHSIPVIILVVTVSLVILMALIIAFKITIAYCKNQINMIKRTDQSTTRESRRAGSREATTPRESRTGTPRGTGVQRGTVIPRDSISPRGTVTPRGALTPRDTVTPRATVTPRDITDPRPSAPVMSMGEEGPYMSPLPPSYNEVMGLGHNELPPRYSEHP